jgi:26S proteasome regulatory subunit N8
VIGWYSSGPKIRPSDLEINELFRRYTPNPVLVIIEVQPKDLGIPTKAYVAVEEVTEVSTCGERWRGRGEGRATIHPT